MTTETLPYPASPERASHEELEELGEVALEGVPVEVDPARDLHVEFRSVSPRPESTLIHRQGEQQPAQESQASPEVIEMARELREKYRGQRVGVKIQAIETAIDESYSMSFAKSYDSPERQAQAARAATVVEANRTELRNLLAANREMADPILRKRILETIDTPYNKKTYIGRSSYEVESLTNRFKAGENSSDPIAAICLEFMDSETEPGAAIAKEAIAKHNEIAKDSRIQDTRKYDLDVELLAADKRDLADKEKGVEKLLEVGEDGLSGKSRQELEEFESSLFGLRGRFEDMAYDLKDKIKNGEYDSVIGDDLSGRYPANFVYQLMKRWSQDHGAKPPIKLYAAPSRESEDSTLMINNLKQYFESRKDRIGEKTLIVTDHIGSGDTLNILVDSLPKGVRADVATLTIGSYATKIDPEFGEKFRVVTASLDDTPASINGQRSTTGRDKNGIDPTSFRRLDYDPLMVKAAREKVIALADEIYDQMFSDEDDSSW